MNPFTVNHDMVGRSTSKRDTRHGIQIVVRAITVGTCTVGSSAAAVDGERFICKESSMRSSANGGENRERVARRRISSSRRHFDNNKIRLLKEICWTLVDLSIQIYKKKVFFCFFFFFCFVFCFSYDFSVFIGSYGFNEQWY